MKRREFIKKTFLTSFGFLLTGSCARAQERKTANQSKPNIVYILADDLGYGYVDKGRSTPGAPQKNNGKVNICR